jgi:hypothetical protein
VFTQEISTGIIAIRAYRSLVGKFNVDNKYGVVGRHKTRVLLLWNAFSFCGCLVTGPNRLSNFPRDLLRPVGAYPVLEPAQIRRKRMIAEHVSDPA